MAGTERRQLPDRTAVIVGAEGNVGASISEAFAREGAYIFLTAQSTLYLLETETRTKGTAGFDDVGCEALELDPGRGDQIALVCQTIKRRRGTVDVLVLCNVDYKQAKAVTFGFMELYNETTHIVVVQDAKMEDRSSWIQGLGPCSQLVELGDEETANEFDPGIIVLAALKDVRSSV